MNNYSLKEIKQISIIVPTLNRYCFLQKNLESFKFFLEYIELFVIDDSSCLEQAALNQKFCCSIPDCQYIYLPKSQGAAAARNLGLSLSSAEYIWFVDDDDFVPVQALKDVLQLICTQSFCCQAILLPMTVMSNNLLIKKIVPSEENNTFDKYREVGSPVSTSAAIFSRKLLLDIGGWDNSLLAGQDTDLFLRISQVTEFKCLITEPVIQNIGHTQRITRAVFKQEIGKIQFLLKHWNILSFKRKLYYFLTFIFVVPLLNTPNLYRLRIKLLSR